MSLFELQALLLGLVVGSFANVCIYRLPRRESIVRPPSRCPSCGSPISPFDNIPVLSWLFLRGRCRRCRAPISARYPLVEATNGILWLSIATTFGPTLRAIVLMVFVTTNLVLGLIDLDHQLLLDVLTLPGIAAGVLASFLPDAVVTPLGSIGAAAGGYLALAGFNRVYRSLRGRDGLGGGDPKMVAMIGAFLGWKGVLLTVLIASLAGTCVGLFLMAAKGRSAQHKLPLGTFLAGAAIFVSFVGEGLIAWYLGKIGG